jgi:hypothetical protein
VETLLLEAEGDRDVTGTVNWISQGLILARVVRTALLFAQIVLLCPIGVTVFIFLAAVLDPVTKERRY